MGLAITPGGDVIDPLLGALKDPDAQVREKAAIGLAFRRDPRIVEPLLAAMEDSDSQVREKAAIALGASGDARAIPALTKATRDPDSQVREKAVAGLVLLGLRRVILAALLAAQVTLALSPCKLEGVPGEVEVRRGQSVRENRDAPLGGPGRMVGLSVIVLSALEPDKLPDPFFMLAGRPGRCAVVQRALFQPRLPRHPPQARHRPRRSARHRQVVAAPLSGARSAGTPTASMTKTS